MRVLVATDLSEPADEALRQAATLAGIDGALAALHVLPSLQSLSALFPQRQTPETLKVGQIIARAADAVRERVAGFAGRDAEIFVEQGTPYAEIVRRAEAWKADIVVVGSHGQSGLERVFGGVAERVVRYAHCRVLVARKTSAHGWVLAATDLSEPSLPTLAAALEEASRRGLKLKVVYAVDFLQVEAFYLTGLGTPTTYDPADLHDPARSRLAHVMRNAGVSAVSEVLHGPAASAIVQEAERLGAELVVVGSHGSTGLARLLLGSVAERIVRTASCSVLVVRMAV
jgi:nucleotide-binding universal stress UspA family protein